jgi:hypothetical protein
MVGTHASIDDRNNASSGHGAVTLRIMEPNQLRNRLEHITIAAHRAGTAGR